jgi:hypothetical protein
MTSRNTVLVKANLLKRKMVFDTEKACDTYISETGLRAELRIGPARI